jgi:Cytochrome c
MKNSFIVTGMFCMSALFLFSLCTPPPAEKQTTLAEAPKNNFGGFESQEKWGEHLVLICGCHDCHSPKMMTDHGPDLDPSLLLSGHPANLPAPDVDRKDMESKGLAVTNDLTAWVGPWGISYAANLTSDATGIGNWQEANFMTAIRHGKLKGIESGRTLLPPMPWQMLNNMTDDELKAVFAYLKTTKPINNVVPPPAPPVLAARS